MYNRNFGYDALGNRTSDGSYNIANFLTQNNHSQFFADPYGLGETYKEVSADGSVKNYSYRSDQRVTQFVYGSNSEQRAANYYYDALGRRIAKTVSVDGVSFNQDFGYIADSDIVLVGKAGNGAVTTYIDGQGVDEHLAAVSSASAKSYVTDHLGSVMNSDVAGSFHVYGAFGEPGMKDLKASATSNPVDYGFAGGVNNPESGNTTYGVRDLDHKTGRWLSQDPIGLNGGKNIYGYVGNAPLTHVDPNGEDAGAVVALGFGCVLVYGTFDITLRYAAKYVCQSNLPDDQKSQTNSDGSKQQQTAQEKSCVDTANKNNLFGNIDTILNGYKK